MTQSFTKDPNENYIGLITQITAKKENKIEKLYFQFKEYKLEETTINFGYAMCSEFMCSQSPVIFLNRFDELNNNKQLKAIKFLPDGNALINRRVRKKFQLDDMKEIFFDGNIISYKSGIGMYEVRYSDGEIMHETAKTINECLRLD